MPFRLTSLPEEVVSLVLEFLSANDILNLSRLMPLKITRKVYDHAFPGDRVFVHYDLKMFKRRASAKLYVFGDLGMVDIPYKNNMPSHYELVADETLRRMHTSRLIQYDGPIVKVALGDMVRILNARGEVFLCKTSDLDGNIPRFTLREAPGRRKVSDDYSGDRFEAARVKKGEQFIDYVMAKVKGGKRFRKILEYENMINVPTMGANPRPAVPKELREFSNKLYSEPYKPTRFSDILASGDIAYSVDESGILWKWKDQTPICLVDSKTHKLIRGKIIKARTLRGDTAFIVEGTGIVLEKVEYSNSNGFRDGYKCLDDHCCYMSVSRLSGTRGIKDIFPIGEDYACMWYDGSVSGLEAKQQNAKFLTVMDQLNNYGPFLHMDASEDLLECITADRHVVEVQLWALYPGMDEDASPRVIEGLSNVVSVAVGESHCLALTKEGAVYSWGKEEGANGCLGLGKLEDAIKMKDVTYDEADDWLFCLKPHRLDFPGKAYAVIANRNYSAVLV